MPLVGGISVVLFHGPVPSLEKPSLAQAVIPPSFLSMKGLPNWFIPLWCIAMPVTSLLIIPSVQGTIPAYMLAFVSAFFVLVSRGDETSRAQRRRYITVALVVAAFWLVLLCGSQIGNLISNRHDFGDMFLINPDDTKVVLSSSLFTQTSTWRPAFVSPCSFVFAFGRNGCGMYYGEDGFWRFTGFMNGFSF